MLRASILLAVLAVILAAVPATAPAAETVGRSVEGRPIAATRLGAPDAPVRLLVVGSIHGDEPGGHAVIRALRRSAAPAGVQLWLVRTANPDGEARGTRQNARGVDLNRNFPRRWRAGGRPFDAYFPGRRPASEPETRALQRLVRRDPPAAHGLVPPGARVVNLSPGADRGVVRAYARRARLPARTLPRPARDRVELAEPRAAGRERVRGRARGRRAAGRGRPPPRPRGAGPRRRRAARRRGGGRPAAGHRQPPDPVPDRPQAPDARLRPPPLRDRPAPADRAEGRRRAHDGDERLRPRVQHLREQRARPGARRAARHVRALRRRRRRHDPPARVAAPDVPPHGRAQPRRRSGSSTSGSTTRRSWAARASSTPRSA